MPPFTPVTFRTKAEVFISRTGGDPGNSVELKGFLKLDDNEKSFNNRVLGEYQSFNDNDGLGTSLAKLEKDTRYVPAVIRARVTEDDKWPYRDDKIFGHTLDFKEGNNSNLADGKPHIVSFSGGGFKGNLWYKVETI